MKLVIKPSKHALTLRFFVPLGWLKWKCIQKEVNKYTSDVNLKEIYQALKQTKRRYRRFLLVEAEGDGAHVKIYL